MKFHLSYKGGEGSGFHGHAGIPGHQGGSQSDKPPALPPELKRSTGGQTNERQKLRAQIMENKYGVKFSLVTSNPVGVAEGKRLGIPGIGLPRAIYDKSFDEVADEDKIAQVLEAVKKWKGNQTHLSYTTLKFATGLSFQEVFGVVKYLQRLDPYSISMTVDRLGKNTAVAIKPTVKYKGGPGSGFAGHRGRPGEIGGSAAGKLTSEAFKKWFGNSKVVNADGTPKVVYHGTRADFTSFDVNELGRNSDHPSANIGFFFAADPDLASDFAGTERIGGQVIPVYLKMENPYHMAAKDWAEDLDFWKGVKGAIGGWGAKYEDSAAHYEEMAQWLQDKGYDGLIIDGSADNGGYPELERDNYVVFKPAQIKSATANYEFNPEEEDIRKEFIVEKQLPIDDTSKANLVRIRTSMFNNEVDALSEKMYTGGISIGAWEEAMKKLIRELHSSVAAIGKGGWSEMTPADWGRLGPVMKSQYQYLHRFAEKIASERDTISIDYIKSRAHLYGNAANNTLAMVQAGQVLSDKLPWLPGDGSTECLINCKCRWELEIIGKDGDFNIVQATWHLGEAEHCDDCVERDEYVVTLNVYKTIPIPAIIGYAEKELRLKGGPGSGFHGHAGIPGHQGGSQAESGWKADPNAWYIDESIPDATLEATQKWADDIASRGWNVEEVLAHFKRLAVCAQTYDLNYDPKWGLSAGTYTAYRVGESEDDPTGIYFGPEPKEIEAYAYDKADKVIHEYTVTIKNPLIVEDKNEVVRKFFPARKDADYEYRVERYITYPNDRPRPYRSWIRSLIDGNKFGHDATAANRWLDAQLASKISKAGYDSLVLLSPELPASREIMIIRNIENNIVFLKEYVVEC